MKGVVFHILSHGQTVFHLIENIVNNTNVIKNETKSFENNTELGHFHDEIFFNTYSYSVGTACLPATAAMRGHLYSCRF